MSYGGDPCTCPRPSTCAYCSRMYPCDCAGCHEQTAAEKRNGRTPDKRQAIPVVRPTLAEKLAHAATVAEACGNLVRACGIRDAALLVAQTAADIMAEADRLEHEENEPAIADGMRRAAQMLGVR